MVYSADETIFNWTEKDISTDLLWLNQITSQSSGTQQMGHLFHWYLVIKANHISSIWYSVDRTTFSTDLLWLNQITSQSSGLADWTPFLIDILWLKQITSQVSGTQWIGQLLSIWYSVDRTTFTSTHHISSIWYSVDRTTFTSTHHHYRYPPAEEWGYETTSDPPTN
jgi:hypothetical protein